MLEDSIVNGNKNKNTDIEQKKMYREQRRCCKNYSLIIKLKSEVVSVIWWIPAFLNLHCQNIEQIAKDCTEEERCGKRRSAVRVIHEFLKKVT